MNIESAEDAWKLIKAAGLSDQDFINVTAVIRRASGIDADAAYERGRSVGYRSGYRDGYAVAMMDSERAS